MKIIDSVLNQYIEKVKDIEVKETGKKFNGAIEILKKLQEHRLDKNMFIFEYGPKELSTALSLLDFIEDIIRVSNHQDFYKLKNLINKLHKSDFIQNWSTNHLTGKNLEKNNILWELYFALQIFKIGHSIELESFTPTKSNSDIIATIDHLRWGFACKVPNPEVNRIKVNTYVNNLKSGIKQLEESDIEKGFVVFNGRNYLNHEELLCVEELSNGYRYKIYNDDQIPINIFNDQIDKIYHKFKSEIEKISYEKLNENPSYWREVLGVKNKTFLQWVNFYFSTSICFIDNRIAVEKLIRPEITGEEIPYSIVKDLVWKINEAMFNRPTFNSF